ncbi:MAG: hypothetical protein H6739_07170 [Alphaproteobacteria bacterium]|nr:hypothetical protein [Alphaproteobacteria bacterium]
MKRTLSMLLLVALAAGATGCSWEKRVKNLSDAEFDHYYALRPFMEDAQRKTYLKLKTEEERNAYLKELGIWDYFYKYDAAERDDIVAGDVQVGWTKDKVLMAWGRPHDRQKLAGRQAQRSELLIYRFEGHEDGSILIWEPNSKTEYKAVRFFRREVILDDDVVTEIAEKNGWE